MLEQITGTNSSDASEVGKSVSGVTGATLDRAKGKPGRPRLPRDENGKIIKPEGGIKGILKKGGYKTGPVPTPSDPGNNQVNPAIDAKAAAEMFVGLIKVADDFSGVRIARVGRAIGLEAKQAQEFADEAKLRREEEKLLQQSLTLCCQKYNVLATAMPELTAGGICATLAFRHFNTHSKLEKILKAQKAANVHSTQEQKGSRVSQDRTCLKSWPCELLSHSNHES